MKIVIWYTIDGQQEQKASFDSEEELNIFLKETHGIEIIKQYQEN